MATRTVPSLPSKRRELRKTLNKKTPVIVEQFPWGTDEELMEFDEGAAVTFEDHGWSCAVRLASGIENIGSAKEGFMARRLAYEEQGLGTKGGLVLAVTTATEEKHVGKYLLASEWRPLCTMRSKDGRRDLTLWGAYPITD